MTPDWTPLDDELARWKSAGLCLPFWWRDDDAVTPTPALEQLEELARAHDMPVHLAVIPQAATKALADHIRATPNLIPVVHGWAHRNHAPQGEKKAEFAASRPLTEMRDEARRGLARLSELFGARLVPMFVPPWNRIAPGMVAELAGLGFHTLSTFTPRTTALAAPGLLRINTHLDPIDWKGGRGLLDPDALIAQVTRDLTDRRKGHSDNEEPYGILTHHLVHDAAIRDFTDALLSRLRAGPCRPWAATGPTRKDNDT